MKQFKAIFVMLVLLTLLSSCKLGTSKDRGRFSVLTKTKAKDTEPSSVLTTHSYEDWAETLYEQYFAFWEWFT